MAHVPKLAPLEPSPKRSSKLVDAGKTGAAAQAKGTYDRDLVRRAQANDKEAYEELIKRHQQRVFAVAAGILRRHEDIEDIAQQVFVKAYFSLKRFDGRAAFSTWLYRITLNECWDLLRKKKVRPLLYESDLSEEQAQRVADAENSEGAGPDIRQKIRKPAKSGAAVGRTGRARPADADFERSGRIFHRRNRRGSGFERQHGESEIISRASASDEDVGGTGTARQVRKST